VLGAAIAGFGGLFLPAVLELWQGDGA
jgi:hypothetical protein